MSNVMTGGGIIDVIIEVTRCVQGILNFDL